MPKATVLVTAFNSGIFLKDCIDSVLSQSFKDFELLIINDGSTDNTARIIASYTDKRIRHINSNTNKGIAPSLNSALPEIDSDYILRMDADDICIQGRFEKQIHFMENNSEIGICGTWLQYFGNKNHIWKACPSNAGIRVRTVFNCSVPNPSAIIRNDVLRKNNLQYDEDFPSPPMEDYALLIDLFDKTKFANIPVPLVLHREHASNASNFFRELKKEKMAVLHHRVLTKCGINPSKDELEMHWHFTYNLFDLNKYSLRDYAHWGHRVIQSAELDKPTSKGFVKYLYLKMLKRIPIMRADQFTRHAYYYFGF